MSLDPLNSEFADDPEMAEILREFMQSLAESGVRLRDALEAGDTEVARRIGHQLKGAGGGYGYPTISAAGAELEEAARSAGRIDERVRACAERLMRECERAQAGLG